MSIGSVLLQRQRIERALRFSAQDGLGDDFVQLLSQIAFDPVNGEAVFQAFATAFEAMAARMVAHAGDAFETAFERVRALFATPLAALDGFAANPPDVDGAEKFFAFLLDCVEALPDILEQIDAELLRGHVAEMLDIVESELKLTPEFLEQEIAQVVDDVIGALEALPAVDDAAARAARASMVAFLRRVRRSLLGRVQLTLPSADELAARLLQGLRALGLDTLAAEARCIAAALRSVLASGSALTALTASFGPGSVGAGQARAPTAGDEYCWYASWLEQTRTRPTVSVDSAGAFFGGLGWEVLGNLPAFPIDEVWLTEDRSQVILRNVFRDDVVLGEGANIEWFHAPRFAGSEQPHFTFKRIGPEFLEHWAYGSALAVDFLKSLVHFTQLEDKNLASHIAHGFWNFHNGGIKALSRPPFLSWINNAMGAPQAVRWAWNTVPIWMTMLAALEGRHTRAEESGFNFYAMLLAADGLEAIKLDAIFNGLRDFSLSLFTLINYDGPGYAPSTGDDLRPLNRLYVDPFVSLAALGTSALLALAIPRANYNYPFAGDNDAMYAWWFVGGAIAGAIAGFVGTPIGAFAIAQASDGPLLGKKTGVAALKGVLTFWISIYSFCEGSTDGGTYNPRGDEFEGYPDYATSPYRLPFAAGTRAFCPQANQGMVSHNDFAGTAQIYAFDFGLDQDELICAARDGTVVDWFDWVANDIDPDEQQGRDAMKATLTTPYLLIDGQTGFLDPGDPGDPDNLPPGDRDAAVIDAENLQSPSWNFVLIRHDNPFGRETEAQRAAHDRGPGGTRLVTYGIYGHGRRDGVRDVLTQETPGDDPTQIIGLRIRRGQPIMRCGNTGNSAINHVHFDVRTDESSEPPSGDPFPAPPVKSKSLEAYTIPCVFGEVTHLLSTNGVCKALTWYESNNVLET